MADTKTLSIPSSNGPFSGFLATPKDGIRGGVLVIQEIFGVNLHIREVTERLADEGYAALAYDAFWRSKPNIALEYNAEGTKRGLELRQTVSPDQATADIKASLEALGALPELGGKKCGVIGFCMGGFYAYLAATRLKPAAVSSYYGGGIAANLAEATALNMPTQFHFGKTDASIPMSDVEKVQKATKSNPKVETFVYPKAGHGFNCDKRESYHAESAKQAWERSMALFAQHVG